MYHLVSNKDGISYGYDESKENLENYIILMQDYIRQTLNDLSISLEDVHKYLMLIDSSVETDIVAYKSTLPVNYSLMYIYSDWFFKDTEIDIESAVRIYFYDYSIEKRQTLELNGKLITPISEINDNFISFMIDDMISRNESPYTKRLVISDDNVIKSIKVDGENYDLSYYHSDIDFSLTEAYEAIFRTNSEYNRFINSQPKVIREELIRKLTIVLKRDYDAMFYLISELDPSRDFDEKSKIFKNNQ